MAETEAAHGEHEAAGEHQADAHDAHGKPGAPGKKKGPDRKQLIIVIASVVGVVIAFVTMKRTSANNAAAAATGAGTAAPSPTGMLGGGNVAGYDPSAGTGADPLAGLYTRLDTLATLQQTTLNTLQHPTAPAPAGKPAPPAIGPHFIYGSQARGLKYFLDKATGAVYQIMPNGGRYKLDKLQYAELGRPRLTGTFGSLPTDPRPAPPHSTGALRNVVAAKGRHPRPPIRTQPVRKK